MIDIFIHLHALCKSKNVEIKPRILVSLHVLSKARIGCNCNNFNHVDIKNAVFANTHIHSDASIGVNTTLLPGLSISSHAIIGKGATVVWSTAKIIGYTGTLFDTKHYFLFATCSIWRFLVTMPLMQTISNDSQR